jgi:hypothetical protein
MFYPESQRILKQSRRSRLAFQALSVARSFEKDSRCGAIRPLQKIVPSLAAKRSNSKSDGPQHLVESENRFAFSFLQ